MSCFNPMVAERPRENRPLFNPFTGEWLSNRLQFRRAAHDRWKRDKPRWPLPKCLQTIPCKQCLGCRLELSRQWASRCVHEASLYDMNSFITLTYAPEHLPKDGSLVKRDMQLFWKKLRYYYRDRKIRYFYCGEYGPKLFRPHYHAIVFNLDFVDKTLWKIVNGHNYYLSKELEAIWGKGYVVLGEVTFESAAYVARYCTKKITGAQAEAHYARVDAKGESYSLVPEFAQSSRGRGIGYGFYTKYKFDLYPSDQCVMRDSNGTSYVLKPPKYYDRVLEQEDPDMFLRIKAARKLKREQTEGDRLFYHLQAEEKHVVQRFSRLVRVMEASA